ncbi:hypothetical protein A9Z40_03230 [Microbacterium arborescens]|uniref:HNH endonuclease n=1 Tax=Microbacterium arborescens TaxID=33883 RepID=A0ABX2WIE5_9MICO|nr:hypothetical protein [Microbacterium arborescens]OAZ40968.1 hypothetical protein A9Z40_03230 [Microbacterium arborescens]
MTTTFTAALAAVSTELRNLLPSRPGLPGTGSASMTTVIAWVSDVKAAALALASTRVELAEEAIARRDADASALHIAEAHALVALGTSR